MGVSRDVRVLNLIVGLAASQRPLTAADIRQRVKGYHDGTDQAVKKKLQRDRKDLANSGIKINQVDAPDHGPEPGYVLDFGTETNVPTDLEVHEYQAACLAVDMWRGTPLQAAAQASLAKLAAHTAHSLRADTPAATRSNTPHSTRTKPSAAHLSVDLSSAPTCLPDITTGINERRTISFNYRAPGRPTTRRSLQPHHMLWTESAWYVAGYDLDRQANRTFKLIRIVGPVKVDTKSHTFPLPANPATVAVTPEPEPAHKCTPLTVTWTVEPGCAASLRRLAAHASSSQPSPLPTTPVPSATTTNTTLSIECNSLAEARELAVNHGHHATLTAPADLVEWLHTQLETQTEQLELSGNTDTSPVENLTEQHISDLLAPLQTKRREPTTGPARIVRALSLATYLREHDGLTVEHLAQHFDVSPSVVAEDLNLLRECSSFPHSPDVSVEASWDYGPVRLRRAESLQHKVSFSPTEAHALVTGLRLITHFDTYAPAAESAINKLTRATHEASQPAGNDTKTANSPGEGTQTQRGGLPSGEPANSAPGTTANDPGTTIAATIPAQQQRAATRHGPVIDDAISSHAQLSFSYVTDDAASERVIDPWQRKLREGHWYLRGWCHTRKDVRDFRLDRIQNLTRLPSRQVTKPKLSSRFATDSQTDYVLIRASLAVLFELEKHGAVTVSDNSSDTGYVLVGLGYYTHRWLARLALSHADSLQILGPISAVARVSEVFETYRNVLQRTSR